MELISFDDFTLLFSGFLITLSVYHFLLYFQHKDRVYLFYSLYTLLIFTSSYPTIENTISQDLFSNTDPYFNLVIIPREWIYNTLYLVFAKTLVEFHVYKPKWNKILNIVIVLYFTVIFISVAIGKLTGNYAAIQYSYMYFFSPTIPIFALVSFYHLYSMETVLKYYIIIGSFIYMIMAETAFFFTKDLHTATVIFDIGVIIENILFALALGAKQKNILELKNMSQQKLITQFEENDKLKSALHLQLEQNMLVLSEQAKQDNIEKLRAKYDQQLVELKIASLRNQMNPHFIFNSLNSIKIYMIKNEKENAVYYLNKFSKLIRSILASTREKEITLANEIETIELYLNIENIRFKNTIKYAIDVDDNLNINTINLPSFILQPFVENAIWHGLSLKKGLKSLKIRVFNDGENYLKIEILDNGIGREKSKQLSDNKIYKKKSFGIKITKERLNHFYKDYVNNFSLEIIDLLDKTDTSKGTMVAIKLPLN